MVVQVIESAQSWCDQNGVTINAQSTENNEYFHQELVLLVHNDDILLTTTTQWRYFTYVLLKQPRLLIEGAYIDDPHLTFSNNVDKVDSKVIYSTIYLIPDILGY